MKNLDFRGILAIIFSIGLCLLTLSCILLLIEGISISETPWATYLLHEWYLMIVSLVFLALPFVIIAMFEDKLD